MMRCHVDSSVPDSHALQVEHLESRRLLASDVLGIWNANYGSDEGSVLAGDFDSDGRVNGADFLVWQRHALDESSLPNAPLVSESVAQLVRDQLLAGVSNIGVAGAPGEIAIFDPPGAGADQGAFSVIHDGNYRSMVAAAFWGSGRVVAFGHNGYTNFGDLGNNLDTGQLYLNSVEWASGDAGLSAAVVTNSASTRTWLLGQGFTNVSLQTNWESQLAMADVLIVELGPNVSAAKQAAVVSFVESGGGLITGGTGWGYKSLGNDLKTLDGNVVLRRAGLAWADGFRSSTTVATVQSTELANASQALTFVEQLWAGGTGTMAQQAEAGEALQTVLDVLPEDHPLAISIGQAFSSRAAAIAATPSSPVTNALDKAVLSWEANQLLATPLNQVAAHPTASTLYGPVPNAAPRVVGATVSIDTNQSGMHATGLYAAPGEIVIVTLPSSLVGRGYHLRLSGHVDNISSRSSWERLPFAISRDFPVNSSTVEIGSAFGGAIYLDVGGEAAGTVPGLGIVQLTIDGAVEAPHFVLGETTDEQWIASIRDNPAPYAELVSEHVAMSVPSSWIRLLDNPSQLMSYWDAIVQFQDWVGGFENLRTGPDRINVDVQISAGLLHAGYPIQGPTWASQGLTDWQQLTTTGDWGYFHELGHEMQRHPELGWGYDNPWTFSGDVEVTVNIFANAALEMGAPATGTSGWGYSAHPDVVMSRAVAEVNNAGTPNFENKDPYPFYFQLADGPWGWQGYRDVLSSYVNDRLSNPAALPQNNQQEKDQWLVRWSTQTGYDLTDYMVNRWGLEVSQAALDTVAAMSLPTWLPLATTVDSFQVDPGQTHLMNLAGGGRGIDGVAVLQSVTDPQLGTLRLNRNGVYIYEPTASFGNDWFEVTYQSSAGNQQTFRIDVTIGNGFLPGDVNLDGGLDESDVNQFIANWQANTSEQTLEDKIRHGDLNLDGTTNFSDFFLLRQAWNEAGFETLQLSELLATSQTEPPLTASLDVALGELDLLDPLL